MFFFFNIFIRFFGVQYGIGILFAANFVRGRFAMSRCWFSALLSETTAAMQYNPTESRYLKYIYI